MNVFNHTFTIKEGRWAEFEPLYNIFNQLDTGEYTIKIEPLKAPEKISFTKAMYGYLYGVVYPAIAVATGDAISRETASKDAIDWIDDAMKDKFGTVWIAGLNKYRRLRKRDMSRRVAIAFLDQVVQYGHGVGADIPPCEYDIINLRELDQ